MSDDYGDDFITLTDEEGNSFELEHLDTLESDGNTYMAFIPSDTPEDSESAELIILKVSSENGEDILVTVDDEPELDRVYGLFMERINEPEEPED